MEIKIYGEEILRKTCVPVEEITPELKALLEEMTPFMNQAHGVGLAAPQIGDDRRFFVMDAGDKVRYVINPEIISSGSSFADIEEGCLSIPGIHKKVRRPKKIKVKYQNLAGETVEEELKNFPARVFQHEFDHLNGVMFVDHLGPIQKRMVAAELEKMAAAAESKGASK